MDIKQVGVVGSGIMGAGIAEVAAKAGFEVVLRSRSLQAADACLTRLEKSLGRQVDKGKLPAVERDTIVSRVTAVTEMGELEMCELVIESVVEDLAVKKDVLASLDVLCPDGTILATNTSTLSVSELAMATGRPDLVCGIHFFNPAPVMPLVEIVPAITTTASTLAAVRQFAEDCGKTTVQVKDQAGFVVNGLLFPYLNSAVAMLDGGVASADDIDAAMRGGCSFPMGPFELLDLVGLDTSLAILQALYDERGDVCCLPAPLLRRTVAAGHLGRKTGRGFHTYPQPGTSAG
ncbi:MAG: 3-hydroxyacyl-CoA dehydrogenase family protein [Acidimicrobiales bacterium]